MKKVQSRREFLFNGAKVVAGTVGSASLGSYFALSEIKRELKSKSKKYKSLEQQSENRILVAYETEFGSTSEIAAYMGEYLSSGNQQVDVKRIEKVTDLTPYGYVIIGSAIQYDKWMPKAREFVIKNRDVLKKIPVAFFFTCLVLSKKTKKANQKAAGYTEKLKKLNSEVKPVSIGQFAGVLNYSKMSFVTRIIAKGIMSIMKVKEGDYRDWNTIEKWTKNVFLKS